MNEHDSGDVVWACATLVTLFVLNIRSANVEGGNRPAGMIRVTYSLYLICQTLQSISSVSNTDAGHHAQGIFLMIAGYSVAITGAALALGGGQAVSDSTKKLFRTISTLFFFMAIVTVSLILAIEGGYRKVGYPIYIVCTILFASGMGFEVFKLQNGTRKMRLSLFFATFTACFNGLLPDLAPSPNMYLITRVLDTLFYLPFACYSLRLYDDIVAKEGYHDLKSTVTLEEGAGGGGKDVGESLVGTKDVVNGFGMTTPPTPGNCEDANPIIEDI
mmetsp:Transcript_3197/g.6474  ORF Transcript_3197/g.6474 Transcript_3197/m.6474 type:complete len:274 (-) Transcript_3197:12-833(-)